METESKFIRVEDVKNAECYLCQDLFSDVAQGAYERLKNEIPWTQGSVVVYGKEWEERRKTCLFSDQPGKIYHYSNKEMEGQDWNNIVSMIRDRLYSVLGRDYPGWNNSWRFDTCLCNYYADGTDKIGWHSDSEVDLVSDRPIVSVSFGSVRRFDIRCNTQDYSKKKKAPIHHPDVQTHLESGSVFVMGINTQKYYVHQVPEQKRIKEGRINLTYRMTNNT
jgi:alkylated DNA repair dioxygenase AlkB